MLSMKQTPMALLVETKLGEPLADFVNTLRNDDRSWPYIGRKLRERTAVAFSDEALRYWFADQDVAA
jgi:hypothetical protein